MEPAIEKQMATDQIRDRNIVDMLRDDSNSGSKKNWKAFRDKLRLKRAGRAWTSSVPIPTSDLPIQTNANRMMMRRGSSRYTNNDESDDANAQSSRLLPVETDSPEEEQNSPAGEENAAEAEASLKTLPVDDGSAVADGEGEGGGEEQQAEEQEEEEDEGPGEYQICCGCTVKHKGAAFGPCGHTFCKKCTKKHHVQRGHCPSCNNFILEILDIY